MIRAAFVLAALASLPAGAPPAHAADLDRAEFRYLRPLEAGPAGGPVVFEPDGSLYAHSRPGFADLRIADGRGREVPWRAAPAREGTKPRPVRVLNSGRRGGRAVALLDLGTRPGVRDRVVLDVPDRGFVGRAVVLGADRRDGPFTRLSATGIYDIRGGARPAQSTVAVFPPSDFRYLLLRATGVTRITGATVSGADERPPLVRRRARSVAREEHAGRTVITLDLGFRDLPVDELGIDAASARYDRSVRVLGSEDGEHFRPLGAARIFRFAGSRSAPIEVAARDRYLRIEVSNGDDPPLSGIEVAAWGRSRALLVGGGRPRPYTLYYGDPRGRAPRYELARLPASALGLEGALGGRLGPERENRSFEPPPDTRSFAARHREVVVAALALAALALGAAGLLALRRRA